MSSERRTLNGPLIAGVFTLLLLIPWVYPTVMFGDDGELVRAIREVGLAHPPGSPVYLALSEPFTLLPFGSVAFRAHLAASATAACAVGAAFAVAVAWGAGIAGGAFAAATLLAAPVFWQQARLARPYPLQALATLLLVLLLCRLLEDRSRDRRLLPLLAFAGALSLGGHQLMLVPAAVCLAVGAAVTLRRRMPVATALPPLAIGGLLWLHLPFRSLAEPVSAWVTTATLADLRFHLMHRQFADKLTLDSGKVWDLLTTIGGSLPRELALGALASAAVGVVVLARRRPVETGVIAAVTAGTLLLRSSYIGAGEIEVDSYRVIVRYLLGLYALAAVAAGIGWGWLTALARRRAFVAPWIVLAATAVACALPLARAASGSAGYPEWVWHDRGRGVLISAGPRALIVANNDDVIFPLWYLQDIGGYAPDSFVFGEAGLYMPWARRELAARSTAVLRLDGAALGAARTTPELLALVSPGSGVRVAATTTPPGLSGDQRTRERGVTGEWGVRGVAFLRMNPGEPTPSHGVWRVVPLRPPIALRPPEVAVSLSEEAWFLTLGARRAAEEGDRNGLPLLLLASRLDPADWVVHNELGMAYAAAGRLGPAAAAFREALRIAPWEGRVAANLAAVTSAERNKNPGGGETR